MDLSRPVVRRIAVWGVVAAVGVGLLVFALLPRPVAVDLGTVDRGALQVTVDHEGKTRVRDRYVVSAPVAGQVLRISLEPGDPVVAGETEVATFLPGDPELLDARTRAEAEARLRAAGAAVAAAEAQRDEAEAEARLAAAQLERSRALSRQGVVSEESLEEAQAEAQSRTDALEAARAGVRQAVHERDVAQASLLERATRGTGSPPTLPLRSPVTGVVLQRFRESRAVVAAGEQLLELADLDDLEVVSDYLSSDAVKIATGMPVRIEQWGGGEPLGGTVRRVEPFGFLKVSALGVEEQRVNVITRFDEPRRAWARLGDGYRVETRVVIWQQPDVLRVPTGALFRHGASWAVFRVAGGRARLASVTVGRRDELEAEVVSGLEQGDRVILYPPDEVSDGVRVEPRGD